METLSDVIDKKINKSLLSFMKLVDPERQYSFDSPLIEAWNRLPLVEQQRLYLYLLYRKWRGIDIYGDPYFIIRNCHPVPFDWNGHTTIETLIKQNKIVIAKHNGFYGSYTKDEANVWQMTDVKPLNNQSL